MMRKWLLLYTAGSEEHTQCVRTLLRYLETVGAISVDPGFPMRLATKWIYSLRVHQEAADEMLEQLALEEVVDYRDVLDKHTETEMQNTAKSIGKAEQLSFAIVDGQVVLMAPELAEFSTHEWIRYRCGLTPKEVTECICGHISKDNIYVYCGEDFAPIEFSTFATNYLQFLCRKCYEIYDSDIVTVSNGCVPESENTDRVTSEFMGTFATH